MTEIEQLEQDILNLGGQIKREEEEFSATITEKRNALAQMSSQFEKMKHEADELKKHEQEELKREIESIEEEKQRLAAREEELLAALEGGAPTGASMAHIKSPSYESVRSEPQKHGEHTPHTSYIPGPRHEINKQEFSHEEQSSLRDMIYATRSAPVPSSMMGGTPLGAARAVEHVSRPLQQPAGHDTPTFGTKKWEPAQMSSFNDEPISSAFKNEDTLL